MPCLHIYDFSRLKCLFTLVLISSLVACSGGDGGTGYSNGTISNPNGTSPALGLTWVAPSERVDNTGLSLSEIAGYRIYYGTEAGNYQNQFVVNDGSAEQAQIVGVPSGVYYLVMTTIDMDSRESPYSSEVVVTI